VEWKLLPIQERETIWRVGHAQLASGRVVLVMIEHLHTILLTALREQVVPDVRLAFVDFPDHGNVGDSAIWLGTRMALSAIDRGPIEYVCSRRTYSRRTLRTAIGSDGLIMLHGGGNFGDLWPSHQELREQVIRDFPGHRILQLPQSIHFDGAESLEKARRTLNGHGGVTLLLRDQKSLDLARSRFDADSILVPDAAFGLGRLERAIEPDRPILWHSRRDLEAPSPILPHVPGLRALDWLEEDVTLGLRAEWVLAGWLSRGYGLPPAARKRLEQSWTDRATRRLERGCRFLCRGRVVVTNRLHGHILCALMGLPHFVSDSKQGKIRNFVDTWTRSCPDLHWCESEDEALRLASTTVFRHQP
jgi:pyruvyl transferase EpsO